MQYWTWFAYGPEPGCLEDPAQPDCGGSGWGVDIFKLREKTGDKEISVRSLVFGDHPSGYCYSSCDPKTGCVHAQFFDQLNVSFVIFDETNFSKSKLPEENPTFRAAQKAMEGFRQHKGRRIRAAFQLAITCWAEQCHNQNGDRDGDKREIFTFNEKVKAHVRKIAELYIENPDDFQLVYNRESKEKRPLLLFYISQGSNVKLLNNQPAFDGKGNICPTPEKFDYEFSAKGKSYSLQKFFSVRYAVVAANVFDYTNYSYQLWPFQCSHKGCKFDEVGYTSLFFPGNSSPRDSKERRDINAFQESVDDAKEKSYLVIRGWNEFSSSGDEFGGKAYTIEPNTELHKYDTTPDKKDPWYFFNKIKEKLNSL
jgi:hypothetical protein